MKKFLIYSLLSGVFFLVISYSYFILIPKYVTTSAFDSVVVGKDLYSLFDEKSVFFKNLIKNKINWTRFDNKDSSRDYLTLIFMKDSSQAKLILSVNDKKSDLWVGEVSTLQKALRDNMSSLKSYTQFCPIFMPTFLFRGHFCIYYNADLMITSKDEPRYID